jgi:predicted restriction endonuclease
VVLGCDARDALEAAHIRPYSGPGGNVIRNGLLLRTDIHKLFDRYLLAIEPQTRKIALSLVLSETYYKKSAGRRINEPLEGWPPPSQDVLDERWSKFQG